MRGYKVTVVCVQQLIDTPIVDREESKVEDKQNEEVEVIDDKESEENDYYYVVILDA